MSGQHQSSLNASLRRELHNILERDYEQGYALPGAFYTDPQWLEVERDELFRQGWFCVGRVDEVAAAGDYFSFDQVGEPILVVHGRDGVVRALANVCRHRGTVIASGSGNCKKFLCPYHHWAYDTTGKLLNAPHMETHQEFDVSNCRLLELGCETWLGFIFVNLDANAPWIADEFKALDQVVGNYHLEQMQLRYQADEIWDTNWKCLLENFMEGYHLTPLHRETLHKVNPSQLCSHLTPGPRHFGYRVGFTSRLPVDRIGHADLSDEEMDTCVMFALPPGLAVGVGSDYSSFLCLRPLSPIQVSVKMGLIFYGDHWSEADIENAVRLFQHTMDEDKQVLARVQQGLASSRYEPGPLAARDLEGTIWDFYQFLGRSLGAGAATVEDQVDSSGGLSPRR